MMEFIKRHFLRNLLTLLLVGGLSSWSYFKNEGPIWVWLFIPIVLISFLVPFFEKRAVDKESDLMTGGFQVKDKKEK